MEPSDDLPERCVSVEPRKAASVREAAVIPAQEAAWPVGLLVGLALTTIVSPIFLLVVVPVGFVAGPLLMAFVARTLAWSRQAWKRWAAWGVGLLLGGLVFVPGWAIAVDAAIGPSMRLTPQVLCLSRLRGLHTSVWMYVENHGCAPDTLQALIADDSEDPRQLICPETGHQPPAVDYVYHRPAWGAADHRLLICDLYCHTGRNGTQWRNVLFSDDPKPVRLMEADFIDELAKPINADFAKALVQARRAAERGQQADPSEGVRP